MDALIAAYEEQMKAIRRRDEMIAAYRTNVWTQDRIERDWHPIITRLQARTLIELDAAGVVEYPDEAYRELARMAR